ncbi:MAG: DUF4249 family protein [Bacteroidales bacterium]|nr:DUF4249 family protein [Bacteroidales bacterium]
MKTFRTTALLSMVFMVFACETDFDVTTDWEDITVVYALLDQTEPVQYIKINKAFLGEGNALLMAGERDSSEYAYKMEVRVEEWDEDEGGIIRSIAFDTVSVYDKEEGIFPSPEQTVYKSGPFMFHAITINYQGENDTVWLNPESVYRLIINNPLTGKQISSKTLLVQDFSINRPGFEEEMSFKFDLNNRDIKKDFKWDKPGNGKRNEFRLIFRFKEVNQALDTIERSIVINSTVITPTSSQAEILYKIRNQEFYEACLKHIPYSDPVQEENVKDRLHGFADVEVAVAAEEFTNYIDVYEPSTTIVQEKPIYTNIENGLGIFSSRYVKVKTKKVNNENLCYLNDYSLQVYGVDHNLKFFCNK